MTTYNFVTQQTSPSYLIFSPHGLRTITGQRVQHSDPSHVFLCGLKGQTVCPPQLAIPMPSLRTTLVKLIELDSLIYFIYLYSSRKIILKPSFYFTTTNSNTWNKELTNSICILHHPAKLALISDRCSHQ